MKCMLCGQKMYESTTNEAIEMECGLLVIRNILCFKCEECNEVFYTGNVIQKIEKIMGTARIIMQEVAIVDYEKVAA